MLHRGLPATVALFGLLAGGVATAGDHRYGSEPQVRLGIDILWGGNGPVYVAPPVAWQPPPGGRHGGALQHRDDRTRCAAGARR